MGQPATAQQQQQQASAKTAEDTAPAATKQNVKGSLATTATKTIKGFMKSLIGNNNNDESSQPNRRNSPIKKIVAPLKSSNHAQSKQQTGNSARPKSGNNGNSGNAGNQKFVNATTAVTTSARTVPIPAKEDGGKPPMIKLIQQRIKQQ